MFSLRSNSIESRFRSILRGNFFAKAEFELNTLKSKVKSNSKNGFASLIKFLFSLRSIEAPIFTFDLSPFMIHLSLKPVFQGVWTQIFDWSLVDTRSV